MKPERPSFTERVYAEFAKTAEEAAALAAEFERKAARTRVPFARGWYRRRAADLRDAERKLR